MSRKNYLFTSESVSEGHPDKVCDQISDAILDAFLENDIKLGIEDDSQTNTRLGCETLTTTNKIVIAGECRGQEPLLKRFNGSTVMNRELLTEIARGVVKDIGYDQDGFSWHGADVEVLLHGQSPDIAMGVNAKKKKGGEEEGAGDQGMMFGFACTESEVYEKGSYMPAPIFFAHKILRTLSEQRRSGKLFDLQPDAKSQVTVQYVDGKAVGCTKVVVSTQHNAESRNGKKYTPGMVQGPDLGGGRSPRCRKAGCRRSRRTSSSTRPATSWSAVRTATAASPAARSSSTPTAAMRRTAAARSPARTRPRSTARPRTRRAISPRTWWRRALRTNAPSRSPTRSASPTRCRCWSTCTAPARSMSESSRRCCREMFRLTPTNIRRSLKLNKPIYRRTAAYGHFGRAPEKDGGFSWEKTDLAAQLKKAF